jgi:hypothetical protein
MANFQTHFYGGCLVGIAGMLFGVHLQLIPITTAPIVAIAGIFGGIAPDLDHDHGRPIRIMFGISAVLIPLLLIFRIPQFHSSWISILQIWCTGAVLIRYPICWIFKKATTHRGIFHSIPAIGIFSSILYLLSAHEIHNTDAQSTIAICGGVGYFIHLLLDELWSVDFNGAATRIKRSSGTALAFYKKSLFITTAAYMTLGILIYLCWLDQQGISLESILTNA